MTPASISVVIYKKFAFNEISIFRFLFLDIGTFPRIPTEMTQIKKYSKASFRKFLQGSPRKFSQEILLEFFEKIFQRFNQNIFIIGCFRSSSRYSGSIPEVFLPFFAWEDIVSQITLLQKFLEIFFYP